MRQTLKETKQKLKSKKEWMPGICETVRLCPQRAAEELSEVE